jgi:hypothetical protein
MTKRKPPVNASGIPSSNTTILCREAAPILRCRTIKEKSVKTLRASIAVKACVELHERGTLPISEGKAVRVQDKRSRNVWKGRRERNLKSLGLPFL